MNEQQKQQLLSSTNNLVEINEEILSHFGQSLTDEQYRERFDSEIKPFADKVLQEATVWKNLALQWIETDHPKYIYPMQVNNLFDNITAMAITVLQPKAKKKHVVETVKSIDYILKTVSQQVDVQ
ncbi:DUF1798 family protein [Bacillus alkalicellulosilyticus]|uniref:DUF1798 family protein n=1 Tax=Alkalihalobacterium alkalicellulosilyticum TaxID=1912214 RepID=UPI000997B0D8|nr:DUF1798 family protein [Bacillus alkalicellulosilyticus]